MSTIELQRAILNAPAPNEREMSGSKLKQGTNIPSFLENDATMDSKEAGIYPNLRFEFASSQEMAAFLREHDQIKLVDVCFTDLLGKWHHCTFTKEHIDAESLEEGFGFDASSIPIFERIEDSDYIMKADPTTCWLDPFATFPTLHVTASICTPSGEPYEKCPRSILRNCFEYLLSTGIADEVFVGPEAEFFLFDVARFSCTPHHMEFELDGDEAYWNNSSTHQKYTDTENWREARRNTGHRAGLKEGYMTSRPIDKSADVRSEMLLMLEQLGIRAEKHHHEVATCQMEVNVRASGILRCADDLQVLKYIVKNVASKHKKTATFMPKPLVNDNGSGMHCNLSLWKNRKNLFYDKESVFHELSQLAFYYIGGLLKHCKAVLALACPSTNSYRRLVPDFEAPVHIAFSAGNRSTAIRVPTFTNHKTKRIEFRSPDATSCPYLAFAAMILAGLDGIRHKTQPPPMAEGNLFDPKNFSAQGIAKCPASLGEALDELEKDSDFLTCDGIFSQRLIDDFIAYKRKEVAALRSHPHPREFILHYGC